MPDVLYSALRYISGKYIYIIRRAAVIPGGERLPAVYDTPTLAVTVATEDRGIIHMPGCEGNTQTHISTCTRYCYWYTRC
jgi:hypothetical protein